MGALERTPDAVLGPLYPVAPRRPPAPFDLTGGPACGAPPGARIGIEGHVVDIDGMPVAGALVEVWQADATRISVR